MMDTENIDRSFREISLRLLQRGKIPKNVLKYTEETMQNYGCLKYLASHPQYEKIQITYGCDESAIPDWARVFGIENEHATQLKSRRPYCILFVEFEVDEADNYSQSSDNTSNASQQLQNRWMVITKGCGHQMLDLEFMEHGFGLYAVLNTINPEHITNMGMKSTIRKMPTFAGNNPKGGKQNEFRKQYTDILKRMGGIPAGEIKSDKEFNTEINVNGSDMLKIRFKSNLSLENLPELCKRYYIKYHEKTYQKSYPELLDFEPVRNKKIEAALNEKLIEDIQLFMENMEQDETESPSSIDLIYPSTDENIVDGRIKFMKCGTKSKAEYDGLSLKNYLEEMKKNPAQKEIFQNKDNPDKIIKLLERHSVLLCDEKKEWSVKKCLSFDTVYKKKKYMIQDGKWYKLSWDFIERITNYYYARVKSSELPEFDHKDEGAYNSYAAEKNKWLCMDKMNVTLKGSSKFEFCDIISRNGELIHVKINKGNTADIAYLFNQGVISTQCLHDKDIQTEIYKKIKEVEGKRKNEDYYYNLLKRGSENITVSFAVIEKDCKKALHTQSLPLITDDGQKLNRLTINCLILFYDASKRIEEEFGHKVTFEWVKRRSIKTETTKADEPEIKSEENAENEVDFNNKAATPPPVFPDSCDSGINDTISLPLQPCAFQSPDVNQL